MPWLEYLTIHTFNGLADLWYDISHRIKPTSLPNHALTLGIGSHPYHAKRKYPVFILPEHRAKHIYVIGGTGSGKTKFLENLIRQDITMGNGFGVIDCHGDLIKSTVHFLATLMSTANSDEKYESLLEKIVIFDPTRGIYATGFNPLEVIPGLEPYGQALELVGVFAKLWDCSGPRIGEMLRNTMVTLAENGLTLLEVQPLLTDERFRDHLVRNLSNSEVRKYWLERFNTLSTAMKGQYIEPVLNKVGVFVTDPNIRAVVGQQKSTINIRNIMDSGKILLVNLSKGYLKENAMLLGALLVAKVQMATMSRADMPENLRRPWHLYVDEFQNFATDSFTEILSEARKYGLSLVMAHQNLSQLPLLLRSSIKANVGTQVVFRVSQDDAVDLASEILPREKQRIASILIKQGTAQAFANIKGQHPLEIKVPHVPEPYPDPETVEFIYRNSIEKYGRVRSDVESDTETRRQIIRQGEWKNDYAGHRQDDREKEPSSAGRAKAPFAPEGKFEEGE